MGLCENKQLHCEFCVEEHLSLQLRHSLTRSETLLAIGLHQGNPELGPTLLKQTSGLSDQFGQTTMQQMDFYLNERKMQAGTPALHTRCSAGLKQASSISLRENKRFEAEESSCLAQT